MYSWEIGSWQTNGLLDRRIDSVKTCFLGNQKMLLFILHDYKDSSVIVDIYFYHVIIPYTTFFFRGNINNIIQYPYKIGTPCGDCPNNCVSGLCNNPCYAKDHYSNCGELKAMNIPNLCQEGVCNATCSCGTKIYKNYPFV